MLCTLLSLHIHSVYFILNHIKLFHSIIQRVFGKDSTGNSIRINYDKKLNC